MIYQILSMQQSRPQEATISGHTHSEAPEISGRWVAVCRYGTRFLPTLRLPQL